MALDQQHLWLRARLPVVWLALAAGAPIALGDTRTYDGSGNNVANPDWGSRGVHLLRLTAPQYADGASQLSLPGSPNPRVISNIVSAQEGELFGAHLNTNLFVIWGQFVDHDMDRSQGSTPSQFAIIPVPTCDEWMDPSCSGEEIILFERSDFDPETGTEPGNPRQQRNDISAFIDASNVYGSWQTRVDAVRTFEGGRLITKPNPAGDLLPQNLDLPDEDFQDMDNTNFGLSAAELFVAGDDRANEHLGLTALHTLFMREHNRLADEIAAEHPDWTDEEIFQHARRLVGGIMQFITYNEWLPVLLGPDALPEYTGYKPDVNPGIANEFSTVAFRFGHTMVNPFIPRLDEAGKPIPEGNLLLREAFFAPSKLIDEGGIDPIIRGMATAGSQRPDAKLVDELRNFLFTEPSVFNLDLAALNIQRGRDHGLGSYNQMRIDLGLAPATDFSDITSDTTRQEELAEAYGGDVELVDPWTGGLSEDLVPGAQLGELFVTILVDQFTRLRDGDRFWYQIDDDLSPEDVALIESSTLADVIRRNTDIEAIQAEVFYVWPDFDQDGEVTTIDFIAYQSAFLSGDENADFNKDGALNIIDYILFQNAFKKYI